MERSGMRELVSNGQLASPCTTQDRFLRAGTMKILLAAILLLSATPAMAAGSSTPYGMGGWFARFDPVVAQYNQSGELFRIEGHCQSACTLFLAIRNVCIDRGARLLFHAGHDKN